MERHVKILMLDSNSAVSARLQSELRKERIELQLQRVVSGIDFGVQLVAFAPDLVIARHATPECDALAALATVRREHGETPFIIICENTGVETALQALQQGATDYILEDGIERLGFATRRALSEVAQRREQSRAWGALKEMEERYRALFDRSHDCLYVHDLEGGFIDANPASLGLMGYTREELPGLRVQSLVCEEHLPLAFEGIEEVVRTGTTQETREFNLKHKDGSRRVVEVQASLILRDGKPFAIQGIGRNITDRKRAEESVRQSDARFRRLMQETGQVIFDYDLASGRIDWEGPIAEVLGYSWEEMQKIGVKEWEALVHPEDRAQTLAELDAAIEAARRYSVEYRIKRKDGSHIYVDEHGSFLRDATGGIVRMFGTMSDITERKNIEDRNFEQARLLYMAHDAILARGLDDTIVYWNESAERLYGWSAEEALGQNATVLLQESASKAAEGKRVVTETDQWNDELVHTTKSGDQVRVETHMTLVRDRQGRPKSILSINRDITARKKMEAQLLRSQRMESIGTLASGIAHDLNNVLAPILMSCQLLSADDANDEKRQWIDIISRSAQRGADLVKQVLAFCRGVEGRRMELQAKNLIGEMGHIIRQTFPKSVKLQTTVRKDIWTVVADPTQLHQVLLNLCVNARDAMPNGGTLTIAAENVLLDMPASNSGRDAKPRPYLMITVADTGSGIPPEIRERIFDPFFTTKEQGKGTGLGLSTSLGIVKSHGGFINVYSEPNVGTVFKVYIPAVDAECADSPIPADAQLPRGTGQLVLLVDDEAAVRTITAQTLQTYGYTVMTACNGAEAVDLYSRHSDEVAVVLMDTMMPVMDGRATIHTLARRYPTLKIISASGLFPEARMTDGTNELVKAYLPKPYTTEALLNTIHDVLEGRATLPDSIAAAI